MIYLFILYILLYCILNIKSTTYIVDITYYIYTGWWFQPLWKIGVGMIIPQYMENKIHVPNHQPNIHTIPYGYKSWSYSDDILMTHLSGDSHIAGQIIIIHKPEIKLYWNLPMIIWLIYG